MDLIEQVFFTLRADTELTSLLAEGKKSIRQDMTSYSGRYPVLCFQVISDVPHLFGDDQELARRVTVQLSVLSEDGSDMPVIQRVREIMENLGWTRISTERMMDGKIRVSALRFVIAESEEKTDEQGSTDRRAKPALCRTKD